MNKKVLIISLVAIFLIIIFFVFGKGNSQENNKSGKLIIEEEEVKLEDYVEKIEDGTLVNTSEKLNEVKGYRLLNFNSIRIVKRNETSASVEDKSDDTNNEGMTIMSLTIENPSEKKWKTRDVVLIAYDKEGKELGKINTTISDIEPKNIKTMEFPVGKKFINTYDIDFE